MVAVDCTFCLRSHPSGATTVGAWLTPESQGFFCTASSKFSTFPSILASSNHCVPVIHCYLVLVECVEW